MITVVTATGLEYRAARKAIPQSVAVVRSGIALGREHGNYGEIAISCGIAGGLRRDLPTGTVLIPRSVRRPDGTILDCDAELVRRLTDAALVLGERSVDAPLLTSSAFVVGQERATWAAQGYAGVDMETGLIKARRVACVRVILDTPMREVSPAWGSPASVVIHPRAWLDLPFLAREGPRCAALAAAIIANAVQQILTGS